MLNWHQLVIPIFFRAAVLTIAALVVLFNRLCRTNTLAHLATGTEMFVDLDHIAKLFQAGATQFQTDFAFRTFLRDGKRRSQYCPVMERTRCFRYDQPRFR